MKWLAGMLISGVCVVCSYGQQFTEVDWGIAFEHDAGVSGDYRLREVMGSGIGVFDVDGDGWLDVLLIGGATRRVTLYRQVEPRVFVKDAELPLDGFGMGVAIADIDEDGDQDVYVTTVGYDHLFSNNQGVLVDVSRASGIAIDRWTTSAAFCDLNDDGNIDLYAGGYVDDTGSPFCRSGFGERDYCPPNVYPPVDDLIYFGDGTGQFAQASETYLENAATYPALGVACHDFDLNGRQDLYVANDGTRNTLLLSGGGGLQDRALQWGVATNLQGRAEAGMGVALGDVNNDSAIDILVTHVDRESNTLYMRKDGRFFVDTTMLSGLSAPSLGVTGFGVAVFDMDHDGLLDIAVGNGSVRRFDRPVQDDWVAVYGQANLLFRGTGGGEFVPVDGASGGSEFVTGAEVTRGLLAVDLDRDGAVDLISTQANGPVRVYQNRNTRGNWTKVVLQAASARLEGASVEVTSASARQWTRPYGSTTSYLSAVSDGVHFGLGAEQVEHIRVRWADGRSEIFTVEATNREVILVRGQGRRD